jgi:hypothetical protein
MGLWSSHVTNTTHLPMDVTFFKEIHSVDTSWLIISSCQSQRAERITTDVKGNRVVQLFHQTNTDKLTVFLL